LFQSDFSIIGIRCKK